MKKPINFLLTLRNTIILSNTCPQIYNVLNTHIPAHNKYSLEHIFPKCYMNKISYNDLHNIYKCNDYINNHRSNYKFTDFDDKLYNPTDFTRILNTNNYISTKHKLFIPEEESRGIISRSIMYISYEYKNKFHKVIDSKLLINWCLNYPPTKEEKIHNHIVFMRQFKRNRFIDLYNKKNYKNYIYELFG